MISVLDSKQEPQVLGNNNEKGKVEQGEIQQIPPKWKIFLKKAKLPVFSRNKRNSVPP